jgi:hypothetical protein
MRLQPPVLTLADMTRDCVSNDALFLLAIILKPKVRSIRDRLLCFRSTANDNIARLHSQGPFAPMVKQVLESTSKLGRGVRRGLFFFLSCEIYILKFTA